MAISPTEAQVVFLVGAGGGLASGILSGGHYALPRAYKDPETGQIFFDPGVFGDIFIGAITGLVFWGIYGPSPSFGAPANDARTAIGSLIAGAGGGQLLTSLVERRLNDLARENSAQAVIDLVDKIQTEPVRYRSRGRRWPLRRRGTPSASRIATGDQGPKRRRPVKRKEEGEP